MSNLYRLIDENGMPKLKIIESFEDNEEFDYFNNEIYLLNEYFDFEICDVEHVFIIARNNNHRVSHIIEISIGSNNTSAIPKRSIAIFLSLLGACSFRIYHNHPNGLLQPSIQDSLIEKEIQELAKILDIKFNGSFIITTDGYYDITQKKECIWAE